MSYHHQAKCYWYVYLVEDKVETLHDTEQKNIRYKYSVRLIYYIQCCIHLDDDVRDEMNDSCVHCHGGYQSPPLLLTHYQTRVFTSISHLQNTEYEKYIKKLYNGKNVTWWWKSVLWRRALNLSSQTVPLWHLSQQFHIQCLICTSQVASHRYTFKICSWVTSIDFLLHWKKNK